MTHFAIDLEVLDELIDRLAAFSSNLDGVRDEVDARMRRVESVWSGRAAIEGDDAHRRWAAGAADMQQALAALRSISATAQANYRAAVAANVSMWTG